MTIKQLIKILEKVENKDREIYFFDQTIGELKEKLEIKNIDDGMDDRMDININY